MQIECVSAKLWICTVETFAAAHELDEESHGTLDDRLRLVEQRLVLGSRGGALREERAGRGALALGAGQEVCASCWERAAIDRECGAAIDVEARVGERAEWWKSWRRRGWRRGWGWRRWEGRIGGSRESDGADS